MGMGTGMGTHSRGNEERSTTQIVTHRTPHQCVSLLGTQQTPTLLLATTLAPLPCQPPTPPTPLAPPGTHPLPTTLYSHTQLQLSYGNRNRNGNQSVPLRFRNRSGTVWESYRKWNPCH